MSHYKPYPTYKDSGVEWLGQVPEHWLVSRLRHITNGSLSYGANEAAESDDLRHPRFIRITDLNEDGTLRDDTFKSLPPDVARPYLLKDGDILLARSGATVGKSFLYRRDMGDACYAGYLIRARLLESKFIPKLFWYCTQSSYYWDFIAGSNIQATIQNVSGEKYSNLWLAVPPVTEQRSIVSNLDRETARIDALIEKKTRFIELLREKRQALITHAVTKGLDPNAKMKDSGVQWLGEVPEHWEVSPIRYAVRPQAGAIKTGPFGSQLTASEMLGGTFKVYNQKNVIERDLSSGDNYISDEKYEQLSSFRVYPGDVLVTTRGTIGRVCIAPDEIEPGILHPCLMRVQLDESKVEKEFFATLLGESHILQSQIAYLSNASTIEVIYSETMGSLVVPIPPLPEQRSILLFIQAHASKLDSLIRTSERSIKLLKERRSALITAAVTGQIDLREAV